MTKPDVLTLEQDPALAALTFDALGSGDLVNLVLQRSEVLADVPRPGRVIKAWETGDDAPMAAQVARLGDAIARRAAGVILNEYRELQAVLAAQPPTRVADIGCGYALFDLFLARDHATDLLLIDIETNDRRHFGYHAEGAAYASLAVARALLQANGVAASRITTLNPRHADVLAAGPVDLAVSFLSCGFHYPVDAYMPFLSRNLAPGGRAILDLRASTAAAQAALLETLGPLTDLPAPPKARRVMMTRA